jgi:hypothetical protein
VSSAAKTEADMYAKARWVNKTRTVIQYTFSGGWSWDDFYAIFEQAGACESELNICALIDLRAVTNLPTDAILYLKRAARLAERPTGIIIVIATDAHAVTIYQLFVTIYKTLRDKFRLVASEDEAFAILQMPD